MNEWEAFDRILTSLHEAALDDAHWSTASALIDAALRTHGNSLVYGDGDCADDIQIYFAGFFYRGHRHRDLERWYFRNYYALDERVPRVRYLPDSRLFHATELYKEEEMKTSVAYNEALSQGHAQNSINVRMDGRNGLRIVWVVNDPVNGDGWSSAQLDSIRRLLPHVRHYVGVRQALAGTSALGATVAELLDTTGVGIVQLDVRGRIVAVNDRARDLLRTGRSLFDEGGFLYARAPEDNAELQRLLTRALPAVRGSRLRRLGGSEALVRPAAAGAAHQPGGPAEDGLADLAGRGARAGRRPGKACPHRPGRGGVGSRPHGDGEPGGGAVGRGHERPRDRRGNGPQGKHDPLACEAHVHQTPPVTAGGPGAAGTVAGRRSGVPALKVEAAAGRRSHRQA